MKNVSETTKKDLCVSCEACSVVCPRGAISMEFRDGKYQPKINLDMCDGCGACLRVCPGIDLSLSNEDFSVNKIAGNSLGSYIINYKDERIRENGASGGVITGLLIEMIKNKDIDGAFVLDSDGSNGKIARLKYFEKKNDIINASSSKYIPASVYEILKKIKAQPSKNYAIVGVSCQFSAIKKYLKLNRIDERKIIFLGLFCDRTLNNNIVKYLNSFSRIKSKLLKINFRSKRNFGWPGNIELNYENGKSDIINRSKRMEVKDYFQLNRCLFCLDKLNRQADISFGDCYVQGKNTKKGNSTIIVRTQKGRNSFEKCKDKFESEEIELEDVIDSQGLKEKELNKNFCDHVNSNKKLNKNDLKLLISRQRKINKGKVLSYVRLRAILFLNKLNNRISLVLLLALFGIKILWLYFKHWISYIFFGFKDVKNNSFNNVIIVGGGMENKGAQAMMFTITDRIKRQYPNCKIYLLSNGDFTLSKKEKAKYNFNILPWSIFDQLQMLGKCNFLNKYVKHNRKEEIKNIFINADCIFEISGYGLSSQRGVSRSLVYLLNLMLARKFFIPVYILPQSMGPYNYPFPFNIAINLLLFLYLKYPKKIFVRESDGLRRTLKFSSDNVEKNYDIVIQNADYRLENIFLIKPELKEIEIKKNSIGIILNSKIIEKMKWTMNDFYSLYKKIISELVLKKKNVYIVMHSNEDREIIESFENYFAKDKKVFIIKEELNVIELEHVIKKFDFIIASRYHSIIHAFKNNVPVIAIGWAVKYKELLEAFNQQNFIFDCRYNFQQNKIIEAINLINNQSKLEKRNIAINLKEIQSESIFNKIFYK